MSTIDELRAGHVEVDYILEIDGFEGVFYGGTPPTLTSGHLAANQTAVQGIRGVSEIRADISDARAGGTGIVDGGEVAITITPSTNSLLTDLLRIGPDASDRFATLATTLEEDPAALTITTNEDVSAWGPDAPFVVWIGQEAIRVQSVTSPSTLNVSAGGRGYYGSQLQRHRADAAQGWAPRIHSHCVAWENRPARLKVIARRPSGALAPGFIEVVNGYIAADPVEGPDGLIEVILSHWSSTLDRKIAGDDADTGLQHGWHVFDGVNSMVLGNAILIGFRAGQAFNVRTDGTATAAGAAVVNGVAWRAHQDCFDSSLVNPTRQGIIRIQGQNGTFEVAAAGAYGGNADGGTLTLKSVLGGGGILPGTYAQITNVESEHNLDIPVSTLGAETAVEWPGAVLALVNPAWQPGSTQGVNGAYADVRIELDNEQVQGPALSVRMNCEYHHGDPHLRIDYPGGARSMSTGIDFAAPEAKVPIPLEQRDFADWNVWEGREFALRSRSSANNTRRDVIPIRGVADAFWDQERYVLVEDDVFATPPFYIAARWKDHEDEDRETRPYVVAKSAASATFPGVPGVLLEVADADRARRLPFADWPRQDRVVIRQAVEWDQALPTAIVSQLLHSGTGNGVNGTDDVLPFGADIDERHIDRESFLAFPDPGGVAGLWSMAITEETDLAELIGNLLAALSAALISRLNQTTGERRLALVSTGIPVWTEAIDTITDSDWRDVGLPASETRADLINAVSFVPADESPVRVYNQDSRGEYRRTAEIELDLPGVRLPPGSELDRKAALAPIAADIFASRSYHRRTLRGVLPWHRAILLDEGVTAVVSADTARTPKGQIGITARAMRVVSRVREPDRNYAEVTFEWADANVTGWAPSLRFNAVVDATTIAVENNYYTAATHPVTGAAQQDLDYFAVGDVVEIIKDGDFAGRVSATITDITGANVQFGVAHGLLGGDEASVDPAAYDSASAAHVRYAYLADDAATLGAAGDDAFLWG